MSTKFHGHTTTAHEKSRRYHLHSKDKEDQVDGCHMIAMGVGVG